MATKKVDPLSFRELNEREIHAIRATWAGEASADQQRLALNTIMTVFAKYPKSVPYSPGEPDETTFLAGRFFVGQCVAEVIEKPIDQLVEVETSEHEDGQ